MHTYLEVGVSELKKSTVYPSIHWSSIQRYVLLQMPWLLGEATFSLLVKLKVAWIYIDTDLHIWNRFLKRADLEMPRIVL